MGLAADICMNWWIGAGLILAILLISGCPSMGFTIDENKGFMFIPVTENNPTSEEECLMQEDKYDRDLCYYALASNSKNLQFCDKIIDKQIKEWCLEDFGR